MFDALGPFHPQIVHTPIALLIFSALFAILGRLLDRDWLRKTSVLLLAIGFLGAWFAVQSGEVAHRVPEHDQNVPEEEIEEHEELGERAMFLAGGALVVIGLASRLSGTAAVAVGTVGLLLQVAAAVLVGFAGHAGGELVYEYGANVKVDGAYVVNRGGGGHDDEGGAAPDTVAAHSPDAAPTDDHGGKGRGGDHDGH